MGGEEALKEFLALDPEVKALCRAGTVMFSHFGISVATIQRLPY
jgi:hypothetical protein